MFGRESEDFVSEWKEKIKKVQKRIITEDDAQVFDQMRDLRVLQALAVSEYEDSLVIVEEDEANPQNYCTLDNGFIHLSFTSKDSEKFKKMVAMHEASHLSITPLIDTLNGSDQKFVRENKTLINILEDMRVNRYLCLKYPGMPRYFDSELEESGNTFTMITMGDLIGKDITDPNAIMPQFLPFFLF